ncbi:MAG: ABC transporter substrate-binding protein [Proteobacteria bacterium]|nr:ABC transporter substrate-binding protein [Pseudomonadota bacterium]
MTALAMPVGAAMPTRSEQLRLTITRYFDVAQLGRNSVGAAWQLIPPAQQADFLVTFENFLVTNYIGALTRPGELTFSRPRVINDAASGAPLPGDGRTVVRVDVQSSEGPPRPVLVALARRDDGSYRIVDVTAEAISLGNVLAADFSSFLRRNGGRLEALIGALHQKIASRANDR